MSRKNIKHRLCLFSLLCCLLQLAEMSVYAQTPAQPIQRDSLSAPRPIPQARSRRDRQVAVAVTNDSIQPTNGADELLADSLAKLNKANLARLQTTTLPTPPPLPKDSLISEAASQKWIPNSNKATWLALVFPGAGQIYNRKYWKLPIIYGGFAGCAYALSWNSKMYKDYAQGYLDIMDSNPNTASYQDLLPRNYNISESQLKELLRKRKDLYRRYRDLSIFSFIGVYLISVIDAYVDAELSDFDITPDLSMRVEPTLMNDRFRNGNRSVGVQCSLRF